MTLSNACWIICSDLLSKAEVASSKINIFGFINKALAIAILCFCPPDNLLPLVPTLYSNPFGKLLINSDTYDSSHTFFINLSISSPFSFK